MARSRDLQTRDLFEVPQAVDPLPASADYRGQVAHLLATLLKNAEGDRLHVAATASRLTGTDVSKYMLDAYTSEARDTFNLPFWLVPAIEVSCNAHDLTNWLVGVRGGRLLLGKESLHAELGRLERARDEAAKKIRDLKRLMGEME